eukprot:GGOE01014465.1.p1 GENE.GGOE01014465.1~~GGOE01014465.1.p1  ORF type:complete len:520 (-),score=110.18 GGOE01014465.1:171-1730(-)
MRPRPLLAASGLGALLLLLTVSECHWLGLCPISPEQVADTLLERWSAQDAEWEGRYQQLFNQAKQLQHNVSADAIRLQQLRAAVTNLQLSLSKKCGLEGCQKTQASPTKSNSVNPTHLIEDLLGPLDLTGKNWTRLQYIFFRPRCCSGINNQIEEFWYATQLALLIGRGVVLPAVAENVTWDDPTMSRLFPFDFFYDVQVVSQLVPTLPLMEWKRRCNSTFQLDIYPLRNPKIVQKKYEQFLNITYKGVPQLVVKSYKDLVGRDLPDCLGVQWPHHLLEGMLATDVFPGDPPLGGLVERNRHFERLRRHTIAAPHIMRAVAQYTRQLAGYLAVHIRVGDFRTWCRTSGKDRLKCPSWREMGTTISSVAAQHGFRKVFVACAPHFMKDTLAQLQLYNSNLTFHTFASNATPFMGHPDVVGMAEIQICVDAPIFIGNAWSTWSRTVHQLRYTGGKKCTTTLLWNSPRPWCVDRALRRSLNPGPRKGLKASPGGDANQTSVNITMGETATAANTTHNHTQPG